MSLVLQLLITTALIALMAGLRMFANRQAVQQRLKGGSGSDECRKIECFHACGEQKSASQTGSGHSEFK